MSGIKTNKVLVGKPIGSSFSLDVSGNVNFDGSIYLYGVPLSFSGGGISQTYVDGSLALRDASIEALFIENDIQDSSIINLRSRIDIIDGSIIFIDSSINQLFSQKADLSYVDGSLALRDASILWLQDNKINSTVLPTLTTKAYVDGSLNARDLSINQLFSQDVLKADKTYVDGSLALRDTSILWLQTNKANKIDVEASLGLFATNASVNAAFVLRDTSISWLNANKVNKAGDTMTGTLNINASLNVLNDVSFGSGLFVHGAGGARIDSSLGVLGDVSIGKSLRIGNDSSIGINLPYLQLDVSNGNKVVTAGNYYGQNYQLASDLTTTSTTAITPQAKVTMTTTDLPEGTYKITAHWMWSYSSVRDSARFNITIGGVDQGVRTMIEVEPKDTTNIKPLTRIFYKALSGVNTIVLNYWSKVETDSTTISDATIELIRVS